MPETNNNINFQSNEKGKKHLWFKKLVTIANIALAISTVSPKNMEATNWNNNFPKSDILKIELATTLQNGKNTFQFWEDKNTLKSKEEMTIDFIKSKLG